MSEDATRESGRTPQRLGCLGWFVVVTFGIVVLLGIGAVIDVAWERYRPITDADIVNECYRAVADSPSNRYYDTRPDPDEFCEARLQDPELREEIRELMEQRRG